MFPVLIVASDIEPPHYSDHLCLHILWFIRTCLGLQSITQEGFTMNAYVLSSTLVKGVYNLFTLRVFVILFILSSS